MCNLCPDPLDHFDQDAIHLASDLVLLGDALGHLRGQILLHFEVEPRLPFKLLLVLPLPCLGVRPQHRGMRYGCSFLSFALLL
jgi:hypothetical protein